MQIKKMMKWLILIIFPHLNLKTKHLIKKCLEKYCLLFSIANQMKIFPLYQVNYKILINQQNKKMKLQLKIKILKIINCFRNLIRMKKINKLLMKLTQINWMRISTRSSKLNKQFKSKNSKEIVLCQLKIRIKMIKQKKKTWMVTQIQNRELKCTILNLEKVNKVRSSNIKLKGRSNQPSLVKKLAIYYFSQITTS